ncbi:MULTISPECIES: peptidoglycan D,D-transpeptidase FtsI family protein [Lacrimispora]|uniref:Peptidoglycan glycosyltransferase n=1 Tax=Lacrimispora celerecrescens TaxID=29354 RepID=A0A084JMS5_9FIRM|nr:penicillin-binding transpeptidase domain-containing protein [Lacrimispora celerecrescens]KEZ90259.1 peptidoglycan glycosyltransferase [Lacrimispora celerecrescens]MBW4845822.1 peptidoglycan glycosyltransferase [Lachnospiraceae bacterium]
MSSNKTHHREKIAILFFLLFLAMTGLMGRLIFLMVFRSEHYSAMALDLHERERTIKAARGNIIDANGTVIATNRTVCTISVIHNQIRKADEVVAVLSKELGLQEEDVRKKVEKYSSREIIKTNVDKAMGDLIRSYHLDGVKVDEDYKRYYPYDTLASTVLGFTGGDNQGIIGLEVKYEQYLKGLNGKILTMSDAAGIEIENAAEDRIEPVAGQDLYISLDVNIQRYCEQAAYQVMEKKGAKRVSIIVMNPQNGEIMAMVNAPEFNLNDPFTLNADAGVPASDKEKQDLLNKMWRNPCINDTYEPGSTFKIVTAAAGLEAGVVKLDDHFSCPGFRVVEDRKIRCHKVGGHGSETFLQGMMNSCNPVLIDVGQRLGVDNYYKYFEQFGLKGKTGIDLPGEAATIMHKKDNMGLVELATVSFGQSFQITPLQLITTASAIVNGGNRVTPHFGVKSVSTDGTSVQPFTYPVSEGIISPQTSETMRYILEQVVAEGSGKRGQVDGYRVGGKTATSEKLPRSLKKYISSFIGFAPADNPQVIALITIDEPEGIYYGGTIAAPVIADIFKNILPYLGIEPTEEKTASAFRIYG